MEPQRNNGRQKKSGAKRRGKGRKNCGAEKKKCEEKGKCRNHQEKLESESVGKKNGSNQNHKANSIIVFFRKNKVKCNKNVRFPTDSNSKRQN